MIRRPFMDNQPPKQAFELPDPIRPASAATTDPLQHQEAIGTRDPYAALRVPAYRLFAAAMFLSVIGAQIENSAVLFDVYERTGSAFSLGMVGLALAIPMFLLALPAGQLADLYSRRRIVVTAHLCVALSAVSLAYLSFHRAEWKYSLPAMYAIVFLSNAAATIGRPARIAILPSLVPKSMFPNAVTWNSSLFETASVIGPAIGGFVLLHSVGSNYVISASLLLAAAVLVWLLPEIKIARPPVTQSRWNEFLFGIRFVSRSPLMLAAMALDLFAVLLGGAVFLFPAFAKDILHVSGWGYGFLRAAPSMGAFCMAMIQAHAPPTRHAGRALLLSVAGFGAATIVFGLSTNYLLSFAMLVLTGAFDNVSVVIRHTLVQLLTPDEMRGRVSAVNQIFIGSSNELGGLESGLTAGWLGLQRSVVLGGIGTILVVGAFASRLPSLRRLGRLADVQPESVAGGA
jgi:MFS family permease